MAQDTDQLFLEATRRKLRWQTNKGAVSVEELWAFPLEGAGNSSLNGIGLALQHELQDETGHQTLLRTRRSTAENRAEKDQQLRLDIIKAIIEIREDEADTEATRRQLNVTEKALTEALARKRDEAINNQTPEQIEKQLAAIRKQKGKLGQE